MQVYFAKKAAMNTGVHGGFEKFMAWCVSADERAASPNQKDAEYHAEGKVDGKCGPVALGAENPHVVGEG